MAILGLMAEIYALEKLKLNLKFEIELVFKGLNVAITDVRTSQLLKDVKRDVLNNPDFNVDKAAAAAAAAAAQPPAPPARGPEQVG